MDTIKVAIKVRPLIAREKAENNQIHWKTKENTIFQEAKETSSYTFDHVFDVDVPTCEIFNTVAKPIVEAAVRGFNGTIFAYGQTSSGKTYTMQGSSSEPGIIPLAIQHVFDCIGKIEGREFLLRGAYMELYNERVNDLLGKEKNLKLRENEDGEVLVAGLKEEVAHTPAKVLDLMKRGEKLRRIGETNMNERSSRSHTIFRLIIESRETGEGDGAIQVSHLNLVDLAGSERVEQTKTKGERFKEGCSINRSLMTLGLVISQLTDENETFVSYRDSKLTRILQSSLGGNAHTCIVCTITPAAIEETICTLNFASRAKNIKNKPHLNEVLTDAALLKRYTRQIAFLQEQLKKSTQPSDVAEMETKLMEQQQRNEELQDRISRLKERLIVSTAGHCDSEKSKLNRRRTWCAPRSSYGRNSFAPAMRLETIMEIDTSFPSSPVASECSFLSTPMEEFELQLLEEERKSLESDYSCLTDDFLFCDTPQFVTRRTPNTVPPTSVSVQTDIIIPATMKSSTHTIVGHCETPPPVLREREKYFQKEYDELCEFTRLEKTLGCYAACSETKKDLQEEYDILSNKLLCSEELIRGLQDENGSLKQKLKESEERVEELTGHGGALADIADRLCREKEEFKQFIKDLQEEYDTLSNELSHSEELIRGLQNENGSLKQKLEESEERVAELTGHSETLADIADRLCQEKKELMLLVETLNRKSMEVEKEVRSSESCDTSAKDEVLSNETCQAEHEPQLPADGSNMLNSLLDSDKSGNSSILEETSGIMGEAQKRISGQILEDPVTERLNVDENLKKDEFLNKHNVPNSEAIKAIEERYTDAPINRDMCLNCLKHEDLSNFASHMNKFLEKLKVKDETIQKLEDTVLALEHNVLLKDEKISELSHLKLELEKKIENYDECIILLKCEISSRSCFKYTEADVSQLKTDLINLSQNLSEKNLNVQNLNTVIGTLKEECASKCKQISEFQNLVVEMEGRLEKCEYKQEPEESQISYSHNIQMRISEMQEESERSRQKLLEKDENIEHLKNILSDLEKECGLKDSKVLELVNSISCLNMKVTELEAVNASLKEDVFNFKNQISELHGYLTEKDHCLKTLNNNILSLTEERDSKNTEISGMFKTIQELRKEIQIHQGNNCVLSETNVSECTEIKREIAELQQNLYDRNATIEKLNDKILSLERENSSKDNALSDLNAKFVALHEQETVQTVPSLNIESSYLTTESTHLCIEDEIHQKILQKDEVIRDISEKLAVLEKECIKKDLIIDELSTACSSSKMKLEEYELSNKVLTEQVTILQELGDMKTEIEELSKQVLNKDLKIESLNEVILNLQVDANSMKQKITELSHINSTYKTKADQYEMCIESLKDVVSSASCFQNNNDLNKNDLSENKLYDGFRNISDSSERQHFEDNFTFNVVSDIRELVAKLQEYERTNEALRCEIASQSAFKYTELDIDKLQSEINNMIQQLEERNKAIDNLSQAATILERESAAKDEKIKELTNTIGYLSETVEEREEKIRIYEKQIKACEENDSKLKSTIESLNITVENQKHEILKTQLSCGETISSLKNNHDFDDASQKITELKEEASKLRNRLEEHGKEVSEFKAEAEKIRCESYEAHQELIKKDDLIQVLNEQISSFEDKCTLMDDQILDNLKTESQFIEKLREYEQLNKSLKYQIMCLLNFKYTESDMAIIKEEINGLSENLSDKEAEIKALVETSSAYEMECNIKEQKVIELSNANLHLQKRIEEYENSYDVLKSQLSSLKYTEEHGTQNKSEINKLHDELLEKDSVVEKLNENISQIREKLVSQDHKITELLETVSATNQERDECEFRNKVLESELSSLKSYKYTEADVEKFQHDISELHQILSEKDSLTKDLAASVNTLEEDCKLKDIKIESLEESIVKVKTEKDEIEKKLSEKEMSVEDMTKIIDSLKEHLAAKGSSNAELLQAVSDVSTKIKEYKSRNELLESEISSFKHNKYTEDDMIKVQHEINELHQILSEKDSVTRDLAASINTLEEDCKLKDIKIESLEESIVKVKTEKDEIEKKLSEKEMSVEDMAKIIDSLKEHLAAKDSSNAELLQAVSDVNTKIKEYKSRNELLESEISLFKHNKYTEDDMVKVQHEISELRQILSEKDFITRDLAASVTTLEEDCKLKDIKIESLEESIVKVKTEKDEIEKKLSEKEMSVEDMAKIIDSLKEHIVKSKTEKDEIEKKLSEKEMSVQDMIITIDSLKEHLAAKDSSNAELLQAVSDVNTKIKEYKSRNELLESEISLFKHNKYTEDDMVKVQHEISELRQILSEKDSVTRDLAASVNTLEEDCKLKDIKIETLEESIVKAKTEKDEIEKKLSEKEMSVEDMIVTIDSLKEHLALKDARNAELFQAMSDVNNKISEYKSRNEVLESEICSLTHNKYTEDDMVSLQHKISELLHALGEKDSVVETLKKHVETLQEQCIFKDVKITEIENEIQEKELIIKSLNESIDTLKAHCDSNETKYVELLQVLSDTNNKIVEYESKNRSLESELNHMNKVKHEISELQKDLAERDMLASALKDKVQALENQCSVKDIEIEETISKIKNEISDLQKKLLEKEMTIEELGEKLENLEGLYTFEKANNVTLLQTMSDENVKVTRYESRIKALESELSSLHQYKYTEDDLAKLENKIRDLNQSLSDKDSIIKTLSENIDAMKDQCSLKDIKIKEMAEYISKVNSEMYELQEKYLTLQDLDQKFPVLKEHCTTLEAKNAELLQAISDTDKKLVDLESRSSQMCSENCYKNSEKVSELSETYSLLNNKLESYEELISSLKLQVSALSSDQYNSDIRMQKDIDDLHKKLSDKDLYIERLIKDTCSLPEESVSKTYVSQNSTPDKITSEVRYCFKCASEINKSGISLEEFNQYEATSKPVESTHFSENIEASQVKENPESCAAISREEFMSLRLNFDTECEKNSELKMNMSDLNKQINEKDNYITALESELSELKKGCYSEENVTEMKKTLHDLTEELKEKCKIIDLLNERVASASVVCDASCCMHKNELKDDNLRKELNDMANNLSKKIKEIESYRTDLIRELTALCPSFRKKCDSFNLNTLLSELLSSIMVKEKEMYSMIEDRKEIEMKYLQSQLDKCEECLQILHAKEAKRESWIKHLETENENLQGDLNNCSKNLDDLMSQHVELVENNRAVLQEKEDLSLKICTLESALLTAETEIKALKSKLDESKSVNDKCVQHACTNCKKTSAIEDLNEKLDNLRKGASVTIKKLQDALQDTRAKYESQIKELCKEIETLKIVQSDWKDKFRKQEEKYQKAVTAEQEKCKMLLEENFDLENKIHETNSDIKISEGFTEGCIDSTMSDLLKIKESFTVLKNKLCCLLQISTEIDYDNIETLYDILSQRLADYDAKVDKLQHDLDVANNDKKQLDDENEQMAEHIKEQENSLYIYFEKSEKFKEKLEEVENEKAGLQSELLIKIGEINNLKLENENLRQKNSPDLQVQARQYEKETSYLKKQIAHLREELSRLKKLNEGSDNAMKKLKCDMKAKYKELETQIATLNSAKHDLQLENSRLKIRFHRVQGDSFSPLRCGVENLVTIGTNTNEDWLASECNCTTLREEVRILNINLVDSKAKVTALQLDINSEKSAHKKKIKELEAVITHHKNKAELLKKEYYSLKKSVNSSQPKQQRPDTKEQSTQVGRREPSSSFFDLPVTSGIVQEHNLDVLRMKIQNLTREKTLLREVINKKTNKVKELEDKLKSCQCSRTESVSSSVTSASYPRQSRITTAELEGQQMWERYLRDHLPDDDDKENKSQRTKRQPLSENEKN